MTTSVATPGRPSDRGAPPIVDRLLGPFARFARSESASGIVLLLCTALALAWANSPWAASYHHLWAWPLTVGGPGVGLTLPLHGWINDVLMAVFFFVVGLEIKREALVGELASLRRATLPAAAALGGMVVPAALYAAVNRAGPASAGWGIPMATDIAFALGVLALLGKRVPLALKVFLTALAIVDDIGAVLVIAVFYSGALAWSALAAAAGLLALLVAANRGGVRHPAVYAVLGIALWFAVHASGVHATIAGVLLAFTIPVRTRIDAAEFLARAQHVVREFAGAERRGSILTNEAQQDAVHHLEQTCEAAQAPLLRFEHSLHGLVAFGIMPLFALANAGVPLRGADAPTFGPAALGVLLGLVVGKPIGIALFALAAVRLRVAELPTGVTWPALWSVAALGGIGFTMSLFVAELAFGAGALLASAKLGILAASLIAGLAGMAALRRTTRVAAGLPSPTPEDATAAAPSRDEVRPS